jgi:hypothetical protein
MSKVYRATISFEFDAGQDPIMEMMVEDGATEANVFQYVRETMFEDIMAMSLGSGNDLLDAIEVEVADV